MNVSIQSMRLERLIARRGDDLLRFQGWFETATDSLMRCAWRSEQRRAAADVADLVALRSPQTVKNMEIERGLV